MEKRRCLDCGQPVDLSIEHLKLFPDKPAIAALRWDCEARGWSLGFDPGRAVDTPMGY